MEKVRTLTRRDWWIVIGLILLALVPSLAGSLRLGEIASDAPVSPANARFLQVPLPVVLHIIGALVYSMVGAFQFVPGIRRRYPSWHRFAGRYLLVPAGVVVAGSGLWMTASYEMPDFDGVALAISRYIVGVLMLLFLVLGVAAVIRRDFHGHGAWMTRAYALALGAGTQVLTSAPFAIVFGEPDVFWRVVQMDAGWIINAVVAEWVISRRRVISRRSREGARRTETAVS